VTFNTGPGGTELGPAPASEPFGEGGDTPVVAAPADSLPVTGGMASPVALPLLAVSLVFARARRNG
jgi:hypothetical protein